MNLEGNKQIGGVPRTPATYRKEAIIEWLLSRYPEQPWAELLQDAPKVFWRREWNKLKDRFGLPYTGKTLARFDSQGVGPERLS